MQNKKQNQTLESAQYRLEISFKCKIGGKMACYTQNQSRFHFSTLSVINNKINILRLSERMWRVKASKSNRSEKKGKEKGMKNKLHQASEKKSNFWLIKCTCYKVILINIVHFGAYSSGKSCSSVRNCFFSNDKANSRSWQSKNVLTEKKKTDLNFNFFRSLPVKGLHQTTLAFKCSLAGDVC